MTVNGLSSRLCCAFVLCGLAGLGLAAETETPTAPVSIAIRARSDIAKPLATLGDVADIAGDPAIVARLSVVQIAELPTLTPVTVDARLVTAQATRAAAPARLMISGTGLVARQPRVVDAAELETVAAATMPGAEHHLLRSSGSLTIPAGDDVRLLAEPIDAVATGDIPFRVRAMSSSGSELGRALVVLTVRWRENVMVATRDLRRGEQIGVDDVRREMRSVDRSNRASVIDPALIVGSVARRDIRAGELLSPTLVASAPAVRSGSVITAIWPGRGFTIEMEATALANARSGEQVGVRRVLDGALLQGVAQADGTVLIQR
jgi:flagella basal body P-ring formation protein FlgA